MSLADELLGHAAELLILPAGDQRRHSDVNLRRSISAAYHALFHRLLEDSARLLAPDVPALVNYRIQRWFDHREMKKVCGKCSKPELEQPLRGLIGKSASSDLRTVASTFIQLQDSRHRADYDVGYSVDATEAHETLKRSANAFYAWNRLKGSSEANIFILSLLLWKNWEEKDRT